MEKDYPVSAVPQIPAEAELTRIRVVVSSFRATGAVSQECVLGCTSAPTTHTENARHVASISRRKVALCKKSR